MGDRAASRKSKRPLMFEESHTRAYESVISCPLTLPQLVTGSPLLVCWEDMGARPVLSADSRFPLCKVVPSRPFPGIVQGPGEVELVPGRSHFHYQELSGGLGFGSFWRKRGRAFFGCCWGGSILANKAFVGFFFCRKGRTNSFQPNFDVHHSHASYWLDKKQKQINPARL